MIIFDKDTKTLDIPAGLGNLEVNIITGSTSAGVSSLDGQTGALTLKTINGNHLLGEGDIHISGGTGTEVSYTQTLTAGTEIGQITIDGSATTIYAPTGGSYELPIASADTLGGVKIGEGISIDENGTISSNGGGGVTSGEVQTMIESALTDYATTADTANKLTKPSGNVGGLSRPAYYSTKSGLTPCNTTALTNGRWGGLVADVNGNTQVGQYLVFHSATTDNSTTTQFGKKASKAGFTVYYPATGTDYTLNTNQHFVVDSDDIVHIKKITQADYDALVSGGTVDEHTLYLIEN